ncbi:tripartite tricarboxylate transporter TctB family protein [Hydrogenophaga sp. SL48]|jgi:putative tricarboxylic transport membrane protein|uniref:tripartite tricarboxylate transporter TctB family protein n=1 Tax=Hydrogenophaga sp. SL48 TaxID=2806347 RepID=UPI001F3F724C|nr:tripartite tricarboxylate transporter TctB family protein [Hydrogenophaga sp. SL48]UJW82051.1 tripartite tricarboxylate transporter TctB family protein [Hydrogenophaga sp. SL48]
MHTSHSRLPGELTFMALIVLFSAFMLWASFQISRFDSLSSPGFFPMLCAATMLVTGLLSLVKAARAKLALEPNQSVFQQFVQKLAPLTLVLFTVLIVVYMLLLEVLGFIVASYLFLLLSMQVLGSKRLGLNLAVSAVVLAAIFIVFQTAFSVVLPSGSLVGPYLPEFLK